MNALATSTFGAQFNSLKIGRFENIWGSFRWARGAPWAKGVGGGWGDNANETGTGVCWTAAWGAGVEMTKHCCWEWGGCDWGAATTGLKSWCWLRDCWGWCSVEVRAVLWGGHSFSWQISCPKRRWTWAASSRCNSSACWTSRARCLGRRSVDVVSDLRLGEFEEAADEGR